MSEALILACLIVTLFGVSILVVIVKYGPNKAIEFAVVYSAMLGAIVAFFFSENQRKAHIAAIEKNYNAQIASLESRNNNLQATILAGQASSNRSLASTIKKTESTNASAESANINTESANADIPKENNNPFQFLWYEIGHAETGEAGQENADGEKKRPTIFIK